MNQDYQGHRQALLSVISNALDKYCVDVDTGLSSGAELMSDMASTLEEGDVRLFKYQPFSERNLQDCKAGVLQQKRLGLLPVPLFPVWRPYWKSGLGCEGLGNYVARCPRLRGRRACGIGTRMATEDLWPVTPYRHS